MCLCRCANLWLLLKFDNEILVFWITACWWWLCEDRFFADRIRYRWSNPDGAWRWTGTPCLFARQSKLCTLHRIQSASYKKKIQFAVWLSFDDHLWTNGFCNVDLIGFLIYCSLKCLKFTASKAYCRDCKLASACDSLEYSAFGSFLNASASTLNGPDGASWKQSYQILFAYYQTVK